MHARADRAGPASIRAVPPAGGGGEGHAHAPRACAAPASAERRVMAMRVECDFRHGLADPTVTRGPEGGPVLSLVRGQESVTIALSEDSLRALWLAVAVSVGGEG